MKKAEFTLQQVVVSIIVLVFLLVMIVATFYLLDIANGGGDIAFGILE